MMTFEGLVNWPQGFCNFLNACLERDLLRACHYDYSDFLYLGRGAQFTLWICEIQQWPGFHFVQQAVNQFLAQSNYQVSFVLWGNNTRVRVRV